jgi:hypothetical protein
MLLSRPSLPAAAVLPRLPAVPRIVVVRAVVVSALVLLFASSAVVLMQASAKPALPAADAQFITTRLVSLDQDVRMHLVRVTTHGGAARAQRSAHEAVAAAQALARPVRATDDARSARLSAAIADELRFLDAAGSALMNPRSPKLGELPALDAAARRALAALPGAAPHRKGGVRALARWRGADAPRLGAT